MRLKAGRFPAELLKKYRYVLAVLLLGIALLLYPGQSRSAPAQPEQSQAARYEPEKLCREIEEALAAIEGAGRLRLVLTVGSSERHELAQNTRSRGEETERETVVISSGSGTQQEVVLCSIYPKYIGALSVCEGADSAKTRLLLTQAVGALTGLSSDRIAVVKGRP